MKKPSSSLFFRLLSFLGTWIHVLQNSTDDFGIREIFGGYDRLKETNPVGAWLLKWTFAIAIAIAMWGVLWAIFHALDPDPGPRGTSIKNMGCLSFWLAIYFISFLYVAGYMMKLPLKEWLSETRENPMRLALPIILCALGAALLIWNEKSLCFWYI